MFIEPATIALITEVSRAVAGYGRLSPDDALDFCQEVQLTFLESGYKALERFDGRSSLKSYLTIVIKRLLVDHRRRSLGRWRASAEAVRRGPSALLLERLTRRDGYSTDEAIEMIVATSGAPTRAELWKTAAELPPRKNPRRIADRKGEHAFITSFEDPLTAQEERHIKCETSKAVARAITRLAPEDRRLLDLRYRQGCRVQTVAARVGIPPKTLYRRYDRLIGSLREAVSDAASPFNAG